eukprot:3153882-Amphidinium_carterae.2
MAMSVLPMPTSFAGSWRWLKLVPKAINNYADKSPIQLYSHVGGCAAMSHRLTCSCQVALRQALISLLSVRLCVCGQIRQLANDLRLLLDVWLD